MRLRMEMRMTGLTLGLVLALLAGGAQAAPPLSPAQDQAFARETLKELVEINTVHKNGTRAAAEAVARRLKAAGFTDGEVQVVAPPGQPSYADTVVRLRGRGKARPLLYIVHLDVVEALPEDWTVDPFRLTEKDGYYYGRGTLDIKGEAAAGITALARMKREGFVPDRDIILAFTSDEESGDINGVQWLTTARRDLVDAGLALNPDAGRPVSRGGKPLYYGFQTSEKVYTAFLLETTNKGGHSSLPRPDNAIYQLAHALERVEAWRFPARLTATTRAYLQTTAALAEGRTAADMAAVAAGETPDPAAADRLSADPDQNATLRTTCVATLLEGGHAENALPQRARATVQCRVLPGESLESVRAALVAAIADPGVAVTEVRPANPAPESPPTAQISALFTRTAQSMWPGVPVLPVMDQGASDSVFTRAAGIPTYGSWSIFYEVDDFRAHGRDERIGVQAFQEGVEFTYRLLKAGSALPDSATATNRER